MRIVACVTLALCAACTPAQERAQCSDAALARIQQEYLLTLVKACKQQGYTECTARPAIEQEFDSKLEGWVACH